MDEASGRSYWFRVMAAERATGWQVSLAPGRHVVGSASGLAVSLDEPGVSRRHLEIEVLADGGAVVRDLGSKNGTFVEGRRVREVAVSGSATLAFGAVRARLDAGGGETGAIWLPPLPPARPTPATGGPRRSPPSRPSRPAGSARPGRSAGGWVAPGRTTVGLHPVERLAASLQDLVPALMAGSMSSEEAAQLLVQRWVAALPVNRAEILRRSGGEEALVAAAASEGVAAAGTEGVRIEGEEGWALALEAAGTGGVAKLEPLFRLALAVLAARSPAPFAFAGGAGERGAARGEEEGKGVEGAPEGLGRTMTSLYRRAARVARGDVPVLILGESGAGKEVLARFVHGRSARSHGPFLAVNCAALPKELLEAEIFGIERGVATGVEARPGLLERGNGGTVFLDEVGDMAPEIQAKVLRVLEQPTIYRVGGRSPLAVDVRFLAATNRDLEAMGEEGSFRRDLYYRLAAFEIRLPPLRDRREEIPALAARFFHREIEKSGTPSPGLTRDALGALVAYPWPGNVRELQNEIAQAALQLHPGEALDLPHLSRRLRGSLAEGERPGLTLEEAVRQAERQAIALALAAAGGDPGRALDLLGISRATFYRKLKELGLNEGSPSEPLPPV
jgi:DNA-binding NtrC family response regulator